VQLDLTRQKIGMKQQPDEALQYYIEQVKAINQVSVTLITITNYKRAADLGRKKSQKLAEKQKKRLECGSDGCVHGRIIIIENGAEYDAPCPQCEALN
jgi:hypothetical protein